MAAIGLRSAASGHKNFFKVKLMKFSPKSGPITKALNNFRLYCSIYYKCYIIIV